MGSTSLQKHKIKFLLLEGIHDSASLVPLPQPQQELKRCIGHIFGSTPEKVRVEEYTNCIMAARGFNILTY